MVSMILGLILVAGVQQWYQVVQYFQKEVRHKENTLTKARTILQLLKNDLSTSGYRGCRTLDDHFPLYQGYQGELSPYKFLRNDGPVFGMGMSGSKGACYGSLKNTICDRLKENSDVLIIYQVPQRIYSLQEPMQSETAPIQTTKNCNIHEGSLVLISDHLQGDLFIAEIVKGNTLFHPQGVSSNRSSALSKAYGTEAEVVELQAVAYYVGTPVRYQKGEKARYALYRDDLLQEATEIVEGVLDFQLEFGVRGSQGTLQYKKSKDIQKEWPFVQTVRVKVILENKVEWEYEFQIRNRRRINDSAYIHQCHFFVVSPLDKTRVINS